MGVLVAVAWWWRRPWPWRDGSGGGGAVVAVAVVGSGEWRRLRRWSGQEGLSRSSRSSSGFPAA